MWTNGRQKCNCLFLELKNHTVINVFINLLKWTNFLIYSKPYVYIANLLLVVFFTWVNFDQSATSVFHILKIKQMVPNRATHHKFGNFSVKWLSLIISRNEKFKLGPLKEIFLIFSFGRAPRFKSCKISFADFPKKSGP